MIKVLIVDDSYVESELLSYLLKSDPEISIIGVASGGEEAMSMIGRERPDVITMDINMPGLDGFETTRKIMETDPLPIIIVSASYKKENVSLSFLAVEAGALAIIEKPSGLESRNFEKQKNEFINTVKLMSEIKVVSRKGLKQNLKDSNISIEMKQKGRDVEIIVIGASTGGPQTLQKLLNEMKDEVTLPILIVQHIASGFVSGFAEWLTSTCGIDVRIPSDGEKIQHKTVYVAPDHFHMGINKDWRIALDSAEPIRNLRPSVSYLFRSASETFGSRAIGVLLTGMGRDGADELKLMRDRGAVTFAQNEESSIVFGMPGEAIKIGGADYVLSPEGIAFKIKEIIRD